MSTFKSRLRAGEPLLGTFLRTPSIHVCEILSRAPFDVICIDGEHAPFGPREIDACVLALGAMPGIVRVPTREAILPALDAGAAGILAPHVTTAAQAREIVKSAHFGRGGRGYAGSTRAAGYGAKTMGEHLTDSAARTAVIAQIEDAEALDNLEAIAAVDGLDALFVGRMDLTVSLGAASPDEPQVLEAVKRICAAGRARGKAVGMFTPRVEDARGWMNQGASFFLLASDQALLLSGARELATAFGKAKA